MRDITYCASKDCPSTECKIKILNNKFQPGEIISMADFSGTCRFYIGWLVDELAIKSGKANNSGFITNKEGEK